ncbi:MAG: hypothetical protein CL678_16505 [Bdellovibrionaceae bacterium]|nr:hypothetical protein [Pseudobdellovibrionaceae bacterium]|tara:strand:- start:333 stop:1211 length:879 start_codon:yes stop_codon:yes gene_type:complete
MKKWIILSLIGFVANASSVKKPEIVVEESLEGQQGSSSSDNGGSDDPHHVSLPCNQAEEMLRLLSERILQKKIKRGQMEEALFVYQQEMQNILQCTIQKNPDFNDFSSVLVRGLNRGLKLHSKISDFIKNNNHLNVAGDPARVLKAYVDFLRKEVVSFDENVFRKIYESKDSNALISYEDKILEFAPKQLNWYMAHFTYIDSTNKRNFIRFSEFQVSLIEFFITATIEDLEFPIYKNQFNCSVKTLIFINNSLRNYIQGSRDRWSDFKELNEELFPEIDLWSKRILNQSHKC